MKYGFPRPAPARTASPPVRGALIEISVAGALGYSIESPPVRGALIEMPDTGSGSMGRWVAPREGGVD